MHIGLYFGSFNPIHNGHLIIANYILEHTGISKVWFVVTPHNPLKESHTLLNEYDRLHLVNIAIEDNPKFRGSNVEFNLHKPSYTADTLAYLTEKFPFEKFSIIMGSDSFQNIERWKNYEYILANYGIIVYQRNGYPVENKEKYTNVEFLDTPQIEISATLIRKMIKEKKSIRYLVPPVVEKYIIENRYYL